MKIKTLVYTELMFDENIFLSLYFIDTFSNNLFSSTQNCVLESGKMLPRCETTEKYILVNG